MSAIRVIRGVRGWSQTELARRAGVSRDTIRLLELGARPAKDLTLRRIARALRVKPEALTDDGLAKRILEEAR